MKNNVVKSTIIFLVGATIGGVGTWLATKTYYKKIADQEIAEAKEWYQNKIKETEITPEEFEEATGLSADDLVEKRKLARKNRTKPDIMDYTTFYNSDEKKRPPVETSLAEMEHPKDSDEEDYDPQDDSKLVEDEFSEPDPEADDHDDENRRAGERMMEEDRATENRDPYVIDEGEFYAEDNRNSHESVFYYTDNDCLVDEHDEILENRELIVGNTLDDPEWDESGVMYVRNSRLRADYEITRVEAEFELD